jgi:hypothetical protein
VLAGRPCIRPVRVSYVRLCILWRGPVPSYATFITDLVLHVHGWCWVLSDRAGLVCRGRSCTRRARGDAIACKPWQGHRL